MMTVGGVCSGIGGLELGLERAGMRVIWQSEIDPFCCRVLAKHWPAVPNLGNVKTVDWSTVERPDLVCGGFPCQPFSHAGTRRGADDPRHLWPHFATCLRLVRPEWVLLENVPESLLSDSERLPPTWPPSGTTSNGSAYQRRPLVPRTSDTGSSSSPPSATGTAGSAPGSTSAVALEQAVELRAGILPREFETIDELSPMAGNVADADSARSQGRPSGLADTNEERRRRRSGVFGEGWRRQPTDGGWWESDPTWSSG